MSLLVASVRTAPQDVRSEPILNDDCEDLVLGWGYLLEDVPLFEVKLEWINLNKVNIVMIDVSKLW